MNRILIIDDELSILKAMKFSLEDEFEVFTASSGYEGIDIINSTQIDIVLLDLRLGECNGIEVLEKIKINSSNIIVIVMTAYASIKSSIEAIQKGAYYYITKPIDMPALKILISKAVEHLNLSTKVLELTEKLGTLENNNGIIGTGRAIKEIYEIIDKIKNLDINVIITGESGTGKELIARAIHSASKRAKGPMEAINCAAVPYNLLESELFGYEKGAFTGASQKRRGKFELANGGTLFLDEIGDMDIVLQSKLLRVIQERCITPLGSEKSLPLDVRIISATNKNLEEEMKKGNFREDLYFRLNVVKIETPPLRKRKEDIPALIMHFIAKYSVLFGKKINGISPEAVETLEGYSYPGNIRQLENIIERAVALSQDDIIKINDLPKEIKPSSIGASNLVPIYIGDSLGEAEKKLTLATLSHFKGNKAEASKVLGLSERHLRTKIKEYNGEE